MTVNQHTTVSISTTLLLLSMVAVSNSEILHKISKEEGETVIFNFTNSGHSYLLQLKKGDDDSVFEYVYPDNKTNNRIKPIRFTREGDTLKFTFEDLDTSDSGCYKLFVTGVEATTIYQLEVVSAIRIVNITDLESGLSYQDSDTIYTVEEEPLQLACLVKGGIRDDCSIRWNISDTRISGDDYRENRTICEQLQEESILDFNRININMDGASIACLTRRDISVVYLKIKRKPVLQSPDVVTEGIPTQFVCTLNDTSDDQINLMWILDARDITDNSNQRSKTSPGYRIWNSTLTLRPTRAHFFKELVCNIKHEERRFDSLILEIRYPATITNLYVTPSRLVEINTDVNISCVATGFPIFEILWLIKDRIAVDEWLVVSQPSQSAIVNETTLQSTLMLKDVQSEDRYRCSVLNIGPPFNMEIDLKLKDCLENPIVNCDVTKNDSRNARIRCNTTPNIAASKIVLYNNNHDELYQENENIINKVSILYYELTIDDPSNFTCCTSSALCQRHCNKCAVNDYSTFKEEFTWPTKLIYIGIIIVVIIVAASSYICWIWKGRQGSNNLENNCTETIGINTLQAVNTGRSAQSNLGSMSGYTTRVHPTSECSGDDTYDPKSDSQDTISHLTTRSSATTTL